MKLCHKCGKEKNEIEFPETTEYAWCLKCLSSRRQPHKIKQNSVSHVVASLQNTDDEMLAYEFYCALNCKVDDDWAKPENSLDAFREMVKAHIIAKRLRLSLRPIALMQKGRYKEELNKMPA